MTGKLYSCCADPYTLNDRWYIEPHRVVVIGRPSSQLAQKLEEEEKARIAKQRKLLGPDGLKKAEQELESAKKEHDKEIPVEILKSFPVPSVKSIAWIPVQSLQEVGSGTGRRKTVEQSGNAELAQHVQADGSYDELLYVNKIKVV